MNFKQTGGKKMKTKQIKNHIFSLKYDLNTNCFSPNISENYGVENLCFNHTKCLYIKVRKKKLYESIKINSY